MTWCSPSCASNAAEPVNPGRKAARASAAIMRAAGARVHLSGVVVALLALLLLALPSKVAAQSSTEVWQAILSVPTVSGSGLPSVPSPSPGFIYPSGIATTPSGDIVVADSGNNLVRVFD